MKGRESPSDGEIESGTQEEVSAERADTAHCEEVLDKHFRGYLQA